MWSRAQSRASKQTGLQSREQKLLRGTLLCVGGKTNAKKFRELSWWSQPLGKKLIFDLPFLSDRSDVIEFRVSTFGCFLLFFFFFHAFWFRHRARELESPSRIDFLLQAGYETLQSWFARGEAQPWAWTSEATPAHQQCQQ
jgi:hypothetical protein